MAGEEIIKYISDKEIKVWNNEVLRIGENLVYIEVNGEQTIEIASAHLKIAEENPWKIINVSSK